MHNIEYYEYPENIHRDYVQRELDQHAREETRSEGGHDLGQAIRWLDSLGICADRDEAEAVIRDHDRKWYDQLAVRFYRPKRGSMNGDKKLEALRKREREMYSAYNLKNTLLYASTRTTDFISCRACNSTLNRSKIKANRCPVCGADLRPESTIKSIKAARARWDKAREAELDYMKRHSQKEVVWLVKIEYHT